MALLFYTFWALLVGATVAAWMSAGRPERIGTSSALVAAVTTAVARGIWSVHYVYVDVPRLVVDAALLTVFILLSVRTDRWWPMIVAALQGVTVAAHLGRAVNDHLWRYAYQLMATWTAFPIVLTLCVATYLHRSRNRVPVIWLASSQG